MRQLHFGCGPNKLPAPWENFDREVDIAKPLPFDAGAAKYIFAEHVIEHVPFIDGMQFLSECRRVLAPGGVLRFAFPDVTRILNEHHVQQYCLFLKTLNRRAEGRGDVFRFIMLGSGHRATWTKDTAMAACSAVGFEHFQHLPYGSSTALAMTNIDGHHKGSPVATLETTVVEATR